MIQNKELIDSTVSYGIGGGGALAATLLEVSDMAQAIAIIIGCVIVCIRAIHDGVKLYRFLKNDPD